MGPARMCEREYAPTKITLDKTTAWTFSVGVDITKFIGINLSAQTGYDTDLKDTYKFTKTDYLCGRTDFPNGTNPGPGYDVAGPKAHGGR